MYKFSSYTHARTEQKARYRIRVFKPGEDLPVHEQYFNSREKAIKIACECRHVFPKMNIEFKDNDTNECLHISDKKVRS